MVTDTPHNMRGLSPREKNLLPNRMAQNLDLDDVVIHAKRWTFLTPNNVSVVRGHNIYYPGDPGPIERLSHLSHLAHELVHVWQYIHCNVGLYSVRWADRRYHYHLDGGDNFSAFGLEQQAAIVEDAFRGEHGMPYRWAINAPALTDIQSVIETCQD